MFYQIDEDMENRKRGRFVGLLFIVIGAIAIGFGTKSIIAGIGVALVGLGSRIQLMTESLWIQSWVNKLFQPKQKQ